MNIRPFQHTLSPMAVIHRLLCLLLLFPASAQAVDWLMLQGTEGRSGHYPVAFMQPSYTRDESDSLQLGPNSGKQAVLGTIAPWFNNQDRWHFRRLRFGMRGHLGAPSAQGLAPDMNYFVLLEAAPNLLTYEPFGERSRALAPDHFSITFNQLPGARIRAGLFKMPGPEESYQGVINIDYIEFTTFVATQVLERFAEGNTRQSPSAGSNFTRGTPTSTAYGFNGVRDWALQVFDQFQQGPWSLSYALALGRGEDIHTLDPEFHQWERYLYLSTEHDLPGGKGPKKHGLKAYTWHQQGKRRFATDPDLQEFDRVRYGVGFRALGPLFGGDRIHRISMEWMQAEGMIFIGPTGGVKGGLLQFAEDRNNHSRALSLDYGFFLTPQWELDLRVARHELLYRQDGDPWTAGDARIVEEITYGVQYHMGPKSRLTFNYLQRNLRAPNESHPVVQNVADSIGNRWGIQWTKFF